MSWLDIDTKELDVELEDMDKSYSLEPGVYNVTLNNVYVDTTSKSGAVYFSLEGVTDNNFVISLNGFSVERMIKNGNGSTKTSNGRFYTGVLLLDKIAKCANTDVNKLKPTKKLIQVFGEQKEVGVFESLINTKIALGIRTNKSEYEGKIYEKFEIVNICKPSDEECIKKLKKRIEKKPVNDQTGKSNSVKADDNQPIPF